MEKQAKITVYGAEQNCASCVNLPSSKETFEWLQAAISRKYDQNKLQFEYIDINEQTENEEHKAFTNRIMEEDLIYPIVVLNAEIVGEGDPKLKPIYRALEEQGIPLV